MLKKEKAIILIDGSNFYNRVKEMGAKRHTITQFDYKMFADRLAEKCKIVRRSYYIGVVRVTPGNKKGQQLRSKQQQLFSHLNSSSQKFNVVRGELKKNGRTYHEKGVDVRMAVDLVAGACDDLYDTAIVVSSDIDLVPAIQYARKRGKKVIYCGFSHNPTIALQKNSDFSRLITKDEFEKFIKQKGWISGSVKKK